MAFKKSLIVSVRIKFGLAMIARSVNGAGKGCVANGARYPGPSGVGLGTSFCGVESATKNAGFPVGDGNDVPWTKIEVP